MSKTTYSEKLKDPRWQKKRLEIFDRDGWCCQSCFDSDNTLAVHHLRYIKGREPWDYDNDLLLTVCQSCHEIEREMMPVATHDLIEILKGVGFLSGSIQEISEGFIQMKNKNTDVSASVIRWALGTPDIFEKITDDYFKALSCAKSNKKEVG